jgi:hypothetical protein
LVAERNGTDKALLYAVPRTVTRFCRSADRAIRRHHVPRLRGIEAEGLHARLMHLLEEGRRVALVAGGTGRWITAELMNRLGVHGRFRLGAPATRCGWLV